jgi:hypothetical protein
MQPILGDQAFVTRRAVLPSDHQAQDRAFLQEFAQHSARQQTNRARQRPEFSCHEDRDDPRTV